MKNKILLMLGISFALATLPTDCAQPNNNNNLCSDSTELVIALAGLGHASLKYYNGEQFTIFGITGSVVVPFVLLSCMAHRRLRYKNENSVPPTAEVHNPEITTRTSLRTARVPTQHEMREEETIRVRMIQNQEAQQAQQREARREQDARIALEEARIQEIQEKRKLHGKQRK